MDAKQLGEILKRAKLREIAKSLKEAGYINCKRDRTLKQVSLCDIAIAQCEETPYFADAKGNEYIGTVFRNVKGCEEYEFVIVEHLSKIRPDSDTLFTQKMLIYAKKL